MLLSFSPLPFPNLLLSMFPSVLQQAVCLPLRFKHCYQGSKCVSLYNVLKLSPLPLFTNLLFPMSPAVPHQTIQEFYIPSLTPFPQKLL